MTNTGAASSGPSALRSAPQRRLRIAVLNRLFRPTAGGAERYSIALVEQLATRHEMHVFAQQCEHRHPDVTYHRIWEPFKRPRWLNQLWFALATRWATRRGFDVVHSHESSWHGHVQTVHVQPVRYSLFHGLSPWALRLRWLKVLTSPRLAAYLLLERARFRALPGRVVVAASASLRDCLAATYPSAASMLRTIAPGVAVVQNEPVPADRRRVVRKAFGVPEAGPLLLFVGNDFQKKGLPTLLRAMAELAPAVCLLVVGNPHQRASVADELRDPRLDGRVTFAGALSDMTAAYQTADVLVHPTLEDSYAMVVLEAMSFGVPVVVSGPRYCGIARELRHGVNACVLEDPRDAVALAHHVRSLLADRAALQALAEAGLAFAAGRMWSQAALQQEALYQEVAHKPA